MIVTAEPADKTTTPQSKQKSTKISVYLGMVLLLIVLLLSVFYVLSIQESSRLKQENEDLNNRILVLEDSISDNEDMANYCKEFILESSEADVEVTETGCEDLFEQTESCSSRSCLFKGPEAVEGLGWVKGYYTTIDREDWGNTNVTCEVLVVTGGSKLLLDNFKEMIENGNRLNTLNHNGELLLNLNLKDSPFKDRIKSSTNENQVELSIVRGSSVGRSVSVCYSFVDILDIKK